MIAQGRTCGNDAPRLLDQHGQVASYVVFICEWLGHNRGFSGLVCLEVFLTICWINILDHDVSCSSNINCKGNVSAFTVVSLMESSVDFVKFISLSSVSNPLHIKPQPYQGSSLSNNNCCVKSRDVPESHFWRARIKSRVELTDLALWLNSACGLEERVSSRGDAVIFCNCYEWMVCCQRYKCCQQRLMGCYARKGNEEELDCRWCGKFSRHWLKNNR